MMKMLTAKGKGEALAAKKKTIETWLLERCDFSGYEDALSSIDLAMREGKILALHSVFMSEVGQWRIPQEGAQRAITHWLSGLAPALEVPFTPLEIVEQSKILGRIPKNATGRQEKRACETWFPWVAGRLLRLWGSEGLL